MKIVLFFSLSPMAKCLCECDCKSFFKNLNKWPNTSVFVAAENGSVELVELVALFLLKTGTLSAKKLVEDFHRCYILLCWDFLRKEKGKYTVTLINRSYLILPGIQHKVVLLVFRTVFAVGFWSLNFLPLKLLLGKNTLAGWR